jgi:phytoene/squalene synthetase
MDDTNRAIERKIALNPVLHAFQKTVHDYGIEEELISAFFKSMYMDLDQKKYEKDYYTEYIYGSAEVVGLMCLKVFTEGNRELYESLKTFARSLGAAFQKVNFLRDVQSDFEERGRVYFPGVDFRTFTEEKKREIEAEILQDFKMAYEGILKLPRGARGGVYLAYKYYLALFKKIRRVKASRILKERIRVPDNHKVLIMAESYLRTRLNVF